eukprot:tig00021168_g19089.t2
MFHGACISSLPDVSPQEKGECSYGDRCKFIHDRGSSAPQASAAASAATSAAASAAASADAAKADAPPASS